MDRKLKIIFRLLSMLTEVCTYIPATENETEGLLNKAFRGSRR